MDGSGRLQDRVQDQAKPATAMAAGAVVPLDVGVVLVVDLGASFLPVRRRPPVVRRHRGSEAAFAADSRTRLWPCSHGFVPFVLPLVTQRRLPGPSMWRAGSIFSGSRAVQRQRL